MSIKDLSKTTLEQKLLNSLFFENKKQHFKETKQQDWHRFAADSTFNILAYLKKEKNQLNVKEILTRIGKLRFDFAAENDHSDRSGKNTFGIWRYNQNDSISSILAKAEKMPKGSKDSLKGEVDLTTTIWFAHEELFGQINKNLKLAQAEDSASITRHPANKVANQILRDLLKVRDVDIQPEDFFAKAKFDKIAFGINLNKPNSKELSSFYFTNNSSPFLLILTHPHSEDSMNLLDKEINELFLSCLNCSDKPLQERLQAIASLIWYCNQIMPFQRGAASIFLILTAALLLYNNIYPVQYSGARLDVDALSFTENIFSQKFSQDYIESNKAEHTDDSKKVSAYWNNYYDKPEFAGFPSQFAAFALGEMPAGYTVIDCGCGNGRDSFFFEKYGKKVIGLDGSVEGIKRCNKQKKVQSLKRIVFNVVDFGNKKRVKLVTEKLKEINEKYVIYSRFFLHAISEEVGNIFLDFCADVCDSEGVVLLEFRTLADEERSKAEPAHLRRFIDLDKLKQSIISRNMEVTYLSEGLGFAKYRTEDAYVARLVLKPVIEPET